MDQKEKIIKSILETKKYSSVDKETISIIYDLLEKKYSPKKLEDEIKRQLHQIWGAYWDGIPNYNKILEYIKENTRNGNINPREIIKPILSLHSSTKERIEDLDNFFLKIFEVTGIPNTIIDYACGLNPLTIFWMGLKNDSIYKAYDIDVKEVEFINKVFNLILPECMTEVRVGNLLSFNEFENADVVFLFKTLQVLEQQRKGSALEVLKKINAKFITVSFPTKSIGGKNKRMKDFYSDWFKGLIEGEFEIVKEISFTNEMVFIVQSKNYKF